MTWSRRPFPGWNLSARLPAIFRSQTHLLTPMSSLNNPVARRPQVRCDESGKQIGSMPGRLIVISILFFLSWSCAAQTLDPGPVRVGDRWSYDIKDGLTGNLRNAITVVVAETNDKEITTRVSYQGKDHPQTAIYDSDWGRIDDGLWRLRPSGIGIKKPLQIGKEWKSDSNGMNLQSGVAFRASGAAKVVAQEQVKTLAGTFDTFRIDMTVRLINTRDQSRSQNWTFLVWYAPAINRWVKRTSEWRQEGRVRDSYTEELTGYARKP